jgi:ATP-dependent RNA helicase RhlE
VLVFTRTKHRANRVAADLRAVGIKAEAIHGNKSQSARTRALASFKAGHTQALIATDLASRGLDISGLPQVVNFELPFVPEDYVHRVGRTGRAGAGGAAVSLVCASEHQQLRAIERLLGRKLPAETIVGFEPDPSIFHEPIRQGQGRRSRPDRRSQPASPRPGGRSESNGGRAGARRPSSGSGARANSAPARRGRHQPDLRRGSAKTHPF